MHFMRNDVNVEARLIRVWYRDRYGQPRFLELPIAGGIANNPRELRIKLEEFGPALVREMERMA